MIHRFIHDVLTTGIALYTADPVLLDDLFKENYSLEDSEVASIKKYFAAKPPSIINGYARDDTEFPAIAIVLAREGEATNFSAEKGARALRNILETDPQAKFLGEVALVAHSSAISKLDLLFLNTLYDENASNHLALGSAYRESIQGGSAMSDEEFAAAGGNDSLIHVDFMFGSGQMDVDGVTSDGTTEPVMRAGEWAFKL